MHNKSDSAYMRWPLGGLGFLLALVLLGVSMTMNYRFGFSLGKTALDGQIYGMASAAADGLKAILPFAFFAAYRNKQWSVFSVTLPVWIVMMAYGLTGAAGHAALNRLDTTGQRAVAASSYKDTRSDLATARTDRGYIPQHRPEATVKAELLKHKTSPMWSHTTECSETAGKSSRTYCAQYQTLNAELGYAMQATRLDARIDALTARLDKASAAADGHGSVMSEADPQAGVLARLLSLEIPVTQMLLILLIVAVLEVGGGLGPYASLAYAAGARRPAPAFIDTAVGRLPEADVNILTPPPEPDRPKLALPRPLAPPTAARAEPPPEWRAMLDMIDFPRKKQLGPLRPRDKREVLGLRFLTWICATGHAGEYTAEQLDRLYETFATEDHREQWSSRIVKAELRDAKKWVTVKDSRAPTLWIIASPPIARLKDLLAKRKVMLPPASEAAPEPPPKQPAGGGGVLDLVPFSAAASEAKAPQAANENGAGANAGAKMPPRGAIKGVAELQRFRGGSPLAYHLMTQTEQARDKKAVWQQRELARSRKQRGARCNRMARAA